MDSKASYVYDEEFYRYINAGSIRSAQTIVPLLFDMLPVPIQSVLDVGCGAGAWLSVWRDHDVDILGLDNDYVKLDSLLIDPASFEAADLRQDFDLQRRFDLVQSLEVAEHLPEQAAAGFVAALCRHSDIVLFSAAPPGQGGENHVNEQAYDYWRDLFADQDYQMYDAIRGHISKDTQVMPWYRFNTFLYIRKSSLETVHESLASARIERSAIPADVSPVLYRARKKLIALLPVGASTGIATAKKTLLNLRRS